MKEIGHSSLWVEKYRPKTLDDYICTNNIRNLIKSVITSKEVPCFIFHGTGGCGKTTLAYVISNEIGCDLKYINGSLETSIDKIRYDVQQFARTSSMMGGKKLIVIDELDRMSIAACESLKCLQEETESNARFIFCTNNIQKIIQPLQSRSQIIHFGTEKTNDLLLATFKRVQFILDNENIKYDKKVLAEITKKLFPDIRKLINEIQKYAQMYSCIDERILTTTDDVKTDELINEMKAKKFNNVRKICEQVDPDQFYTLFYSQIDQQLKDNAKPNVILTLARYAFQHTTTIDKTINLTACCIELMQEGDIWR